MLRIYSRVFDVMRELFAFGVPTQKQLGLADTTPNCSLRMLEVWNRLSLRLLEILAYGAVK